MSDFDSDIQSVQSGYGFCLHVSAGPPHSLSTYGVRSISKTLKELMSEFKSSRNCEQISTWFLASLCMQDLKILKKYIIIRLFAIGFVLRGQKLDKKKKRQL